MLSFNCNGGINVVKAKGNYIGIGCSDGWIYLFKGDKLLWEKKLSTTYYRDPYTDVNILSLDIGKDILAVGTDFMDGKIYLYSLSGDVRWYKQFLTIVGCWERPDDVVAVAIGGDRIAVASEWLNSYIHEIGFGGENIDTRRLDGYIKDIAFWKEQILIGTTKAFYIGRKKKNLKIERIIALNSSAVISAQDGIYTFNGTLKKIYDAENPFVSASQKIIACYDEKLNVLSHDGEILWSCEADKPCGMLCDDRRVYLGYDDYIKVFEDSEFVSEIKVPGSLAGITDDYIVSVKDRDLHLYPLSEIP